MLIATYAIKLNPIKKQETPKTPKNQYKVLAPMKRMQQNFADYLDIF